MCRLRLIDWKHGPEIADVEDPEPGPGEVRIRIGGAGACHSDLHLMYDFEGDLLPWGPPFTLGHENAGWVDALGPGASGVEVGEPVAVYGPWGCGSCHRCVQGLENYCVHQASLPFAGGGLGTDGGMAAYMVVPDARYLVLLGDLDPVDAAPLTDAVLTPYHAIKRSLPLLIPGSTAVVVGAGGLGHMAIQILNALSPRDHRSRCRCEGTRAGADRRRPRDRAHGRGRHRNRSYVDSWRRRRRHPRLRGRRRNTSVRREHRPIARSPDARRDRRRDVADRLFTVPYELSVATTYWGSIPELIEVIALAQAGKINAPCERFSLDDAPRAYELMRVGDLHGRAVVVPS